MTKYNKMKLEIFERDIEKNKTYISRDKRGTSHYQENLDKLNKAIEEIKSNEDISISYEIQEEKEKVKILDRFILDNDFYFGSDDVESIDKDVLRISKKYNISVEDSLKVILLGLDIMGLNARIGMNDIFIEAIKKTDKDLSKYPTTESLKKEKEELIHQILTITKRENFISFDKFANIYLKELEKLRGQSIEFDKFLDWLEASRDYGICSSFCEEESEGYSYLYVPFLKEEISVDMVKGRL